MKLFVKMLMLVMLVAVTMGATGCSKVPSGHVGVKVYLLGGEKGVDTEELGVGRYWIGVNEELYLFPTFTQNYVWTADEKEGSPNNESITFQTKNGMAVNGDFGISYAIDPTQVSTIFQKYRKGIDEITDLYMRNMVRDALVTAASTKDIETIYGIGKADFIEEVETMVKAQCDPIGIKVEKIYLIGSMRLPKTVVNALNNKIEATQKAQARQNEVAEAKAAADKKIEESRGRAQSIRNVAEAERDALEMKAKVLRQNPSLIEYEKIQKWNGVLPQVSGSGAGILLNMAQK